MYTLGKPSIMEESYFAKVEFGKRKKHRLESENSHHIQSKANAMSCPTCCGEMKASICHGVSVAKCLSCNGMFIDEDRLGSIEGNETGFIDTLMGLFKA